MNLWFLAVGFLGAGGSLARGDELTQSEDFLIERNTVTIEPREHVSISALEIDNRFGDVTVVGHDGNTASLTAVKRAPDGQTLDRLRVNLTTDEAGKITIGCARAMGDETRPVALGAVRIDVSLELPRGARVSVRAWNGRIAVAGMRAGADLTAHNGEIIVSDVRGPVTTAATRGRQQLTSVRGVVSAGSTFGELTLDGIAGESLAASLHEGTLVATRVRSRVVKLHTTMGDVLFTGELLALGRYDIRSYSGDIDVRVSGLSFTLDAYSRSGRIDPQLELTDIDRPGPGRLIGTYGALRKKPALVVVRSTTGDVRVGMLNE